MLPWLHCSCIRAHQPVEFPIKLLMQPCKQASATLCTSEHLVGQETRKEKSYWVLQRNILKEKCFRGNFSNFSRLREMYGETNFKKKALDNYDIYI